MRPAVRAQRVDGVVATRHDQRVVEHRRGRIEAYVDVEEFTRRRLREAECLADQARHDAVVDEALHERRVRDSVTTVGEDDRDAAESARVRELEAEGADDAPAPA